MSNTTIQLRKSGQTGNTPADLAHGELAINYADGKLFYKNGVGIKAIENQKTFSTVNSNNSLIIATSPTDILNIVPGNNIAISTNTTSKTITINSTASGGGDGTLAQAAYNTANAAFDEANTKTDFFYQNTTPAVANTGDIWINSDTGFEYTNFGNVSNPTWAETGPTAASSNTVHTNTLAQAAFDKANNAIPLTGSSSITGNLTPATTNTYYLGSDTNRWHSLYVGPGSIDLGGLRLSNTNGSLTVTTSTGQVVPSTGVDDYARDTANNASSNTVALQAVNTTQNTNITSINTFAGAAFTKANNALANTSGTLDGNLNITGNVGIGIVSPGSRLDVKGTLRLSGATSGYVGLAPGAAAGSTTYTLPTADGTTGQVLSTNGSGTLSWATAGGSSFPSGTLMLFQQTAAPTGWTKQITHDNKALRVVSGSASSGGSVAFTTAFASQGVSGTVGSTTLSTSQIPSHSHNIDTITGTDGGGGNSGVAGYVGVAQTAGATFGTSSAGSGGSHNHSFSGTAINLAVSYVDLIIASKD